MSDDDKITNKDINNTLTSMKDNHLNHIQKNTEATNRLLEYFKKEYEAGKGKVNRIIWGFAVFGVVFMIEQWLLEMLT